MLNDWDIERPDRDFPGYHDAMEWEEWDEDGHFLIEEENETDD